MKTVSRFNIPLPKEGIQYKRFSLRLPIHRQLVHLGILGYHPTPSMWILLDNSDAGKENAEFFICCTHTRIPSDIALSHIGTFGNTCKDIEIVWHVFEIIKDY